MAGTEVTDGRVRVVSWNLHEGLPSEGEPVGCDRPDTHGEVVRLLTSRRIDIAAFQEVGFDADGDSEVLEAVRRRTDLRYIAAHPLHESSFFPGRRSGVAVASRFPLRNRGHYELPNPGLTIRVDGRELRSHDKGLVGATASVRGTDLSVVSLHALPFSLFDRDPGDAEFQRIWDDLAGELRRRAERRLLLVCGDFNTDDRDLVLGSGTVPLASSMRGRPTYRDRSVDDLLHGPGVSVTRTEVVRTFSDHLACVAEFRMPTAAEQP